MISRIAGLSMSRFDAFAESFAHLDRQVEEKNRNGDYFRFLGVKPLASGEAAELNLSIGLIESAIILDKKFQTLARSGRDLDSAELTAIRQERVMNLLAETAILRKYLLTDFSGKLMGYLVFVIRPDLRGAQGTLFAASYDFSRIASFSRDQFNGEEKKLISVLLVKQVTERRSFWIRGEEYISLRRTWLEENMILFQVAVFPRFYEFISLYFLALVLVGSLAYLILGHASARATRRELSERLLAGYDKALSARSSAIEEMANSLGGIKEKLVETQNVTSEIEARIAAAQAEARAAAEQKTRPIVIELMPENRQFRFMNPAVVLDPAPARKPLLSADEEKLRARAFTSELKSLMASMGEPVAEVVSRSTGAPRPKDATLIARISKFEEEFRFPEIDQYLYFLNELYFDDVTEAELAEAMRVAGDTIQSREFAILLYDSRRAVFKTGFSYGVPPEIAQSFYLLPKDSVIPNDFADYGYIEVSATLKKNPYFRKRFPTGFTDQLKGIHIFNLAETYLRARIVFFDMSRGGALADQDSIQSIRGYLRQIAPAINMFFLEAGEEGGNARDLADWAIHELKECVSLAAENEPPMISQYVFESALPLDLLLTLTRDIAERLTEGEKILILSPSHFVVAHASGSGKALEDILIAGGGGRKFIIKESEFGKFTRNLYTFIEF